MLPASPEQIRRPPSHASTVRPIVSERYRIRPLRPLAEANFPDRRGSTGGNLKALLVHLIFEAYHKPELFDLQPPNAPAGERPTLNEQLAPKKED